MALLGNSTCDLALGVGEHWYWKIGGLSVHGQVLVMSWLVFASLVFVCLFGNRNLSTDLPKGFQNLTEFVTEYIRDLTKTQVGGTTCSSMDSVCGHNFFIRFCKQLDGCVVTLESVGTSRR